MHNLRLTELAETTAAGRHLFMEVSNTIIFYDVTITYSTGKLERGRNPSFDVISYVWTLRIAPTLQNALLCHSLDLLQCRSM